MRIERNNNIINNNQTNNITNRSNSNTKNDSIFLDKNNNGIVDKEDFSTEQWESITGNGLSDFFNGQKWSDGLSNLFSRILNLGDKENKGDNEPITIIPKESYLSKKSVLFDDESRTLKIAEFLTDDEYVDYKEVKYDENGEIISTKDFDRHNLYRNTKHNKDFVVSTRELSDYIETQGFKRLGERVFTDEEINENMQMMGKRVWDYSDKNVNSFPLEKGYYLVEDDQGEMMYNITDTLVSKLIHKDGYDEIEKFNDNGEKLKDIKRTCDDNGIITDFVTDSNGNKYIEKYESVDLLGEATEKEVILLDEDNQVINSYKTTRHYTTNENGKVCEEVRTYKDGHIEKINIDANGNVIG